MKKKMVYVECLVCRKSFQRSASEVARSKKLGRRTYCSLRCTGIDNVENMPPPTAASANHLPKGSERDEYSPFREHLKSARTHAKQRNRECSITLEDLKNQWEKQNGRCIYTGWAMLNPRITSDRINSPNKASLDRRDSSKGYTPENIQFVTMMANFAKNKFHENDLIAFCMAVAEHRAEKSAESPCNPLTIHIMESSGTQEGTS